MSTKLFLIASSLLITMNCVNVSYTMEDNYGVYNQEQNKTNLDEMEKELNNKIYKFANKICSQNQFTDVDLEMRSIKKIIKYLVNNKDIMNSTRIFNNLGDFFVSFGNNFKELTNDDWSAMIAFQVVWKHIKDKGIMNDHNWYMKFISILNSQKSINDLKIHQELNNRIQDNEM